MMVNKKFTSPNVERLLEHPDYERILQEVLDGQYQIELFERICLEAKDETHAQALYIRARLRQKIK
ncbi:hypothetical protein [Colwellia psychrerythraea]|uniref:Uncharacterized protein n=1 Tax=Colwellia psychrerythraea TaxID=28229 RepID=A0A099KN99_COLPS|nr:hypothetical protein [Colwellia psychrerythraea]KGJ91690.1 hypothetical protein GAB14E_3172 [Colwellia psychrerythraea]